MPKFVADLHIHSHYSRATSKDLDLEHLSQWAQMKGVQIVATGDIAHPGWLAELKQKLEPAEAGLFRLKEEYAAAVQATVPAACQAPVRFMLAGEVSNIYKKNGQVRKIHHLIFMPHLAAVEKLQAALEKIGNIRADGRPILGLDSRNLLEIVLETDPQAYLIPAHIWTPWFAILGSKSGFDTIEECFDDLTPQIFALETGLSSDPPMNWRVSQLDRYTLISNSDAHSPPRLAREATLFDTELSYPALFAALKSGDPQTFRGTIEFFPEEGKYHVDGHRKCGIRWEPETTLAHGGVCPVCGKEVTVGVMNRVMTLADRSVGGRPDRIHPYYNLIALPEILAEVYGMGAGSKAVQQNYESLLVKLGPELAILQDRPLNEIERVGGALLAEGIRRMRNGEVSIDAGYDGDYGVIKLFEAQERTVSSAQLGFFATSTKTPSPNRKAQRAREEQADAARPALGQAPEEVEAASTEQAASAAVYVEPPLLAGLNAEQCQAVLCVDRPLLIVAGPGTGKTRTLTHRIAWLIEQEGAAPESILAITFTNKAAEEMRQRLEQLLGVVVSQRITIKTFHAFGALLLHELGDQLGLPAAFGIASDEDRLALLKQIQPGWGEKALQEALEQISAAKNQLASPNDLTPVEATFVDLYRAYEVALRQNGLVDFDDLLLLPVRLLENQPEPLRRLQDRYRWISVDEYQDINLAQYRLLRLLTAGGANLCAIGDPDQAIYSFRGADRTYFLQFQSDFPDAHLLRLTQNYRSTQLLLEASSQVIAGNADGARLKLWSDFFDQTKLDIHPAPTDKAEAEYVVHQIEQMVGGTSLFSLDSGRVGGADTAQWSFADFAVLYRLSAQSQPLIEAFERSGIPYQTVGQTPLVEYKEIREILACLWSIHNPQADLYREIVLDAAPARQSPHIHAFLAKLHATRHPEGTRPGATEHVTHLIEQVQNFLTSVHTQPLSAKQLERIQQLALRAAPFGDRLGDFLESMALQGETDAYDPRADRVTLMTLHAAKGLEFPVVFMVGCEEGLLPLELPNRQSDVAEERRLFYVGMTRAQQKLSLTHARTRFLFGQRMHNEPSRFVGDIEQTLIEIKRMAERRMLKEKPMLEQLSLF